MRNLTHTRARAVGHAHAHACTHLQSSFVFRLCYSILWQRKRRCICIRQTSNRQFRGRQDAVCRKSYHSDSIEICSVLDRIDSRRNECYVQHNCRFNKLTLSNKFLYFHFLLVYKNHCYKVCVKQ